MNTDKIQNFIWDFDGTLFDTYPHTMDCMIKAMEHFGIKQDRQELYGWIMETIPYAIQRLNEKCEKGIDISSVCWSYSDPDIEKRGLPYQGTEEILKYVTSTGKRNFMFTNRSSEVHDFLKHFDMEKFFTRIVTIADGVKQKPSPEAIFFLMDGYGIKKEDSIMIGDRQIDVLSGKNAGVYTCHITNGLPYKEFDTDIRVENLAELLKILKRAV